MDEPRSHIVSELLASPTQAARSFLILISVALPLYFLAHGVYNIFFHPLRHYPGPFLAGLTKVTKDYYVLRGDAVHWTTRCHDKYGTVVRVQPNVLSFTDPQAWKDIYGPKASGKSSNHKPQRTDLRYPGHPPLIAIHDDRAHGKQRRIFSHAFSDQALKKQEPMFQKYVDMLVESLNNQTSEDPQRKFDMVEYLNFTTFDIMGDLTFTESLGLLRDRQYSSWVRMVFSAIKASVMFEVARHYPPLTSLLKSLVPPSLKKNIESNMKHAEDRVDRRLEKGSDKPDIWSLILKQEGDMALSKEAMYENSSLFMVAGTETTATLLSGLLFYLLKNPSKMDLLRAELLEAFPGGKGVNSEKLQGLPYLRACLEEGLRIYPPVPFGLPRIIPPEGGEVCGKWVPGGTEVASTHLSTYRSERNFALAREFHPERWLDDSSKGGSDPRFANDQKAALMPFSYGPRNCLGRNMAYYEMRLILCRLLLAFDFDLQPESAEWADQQIFALWQKKPLICKLRPRVAAL